MKATVARSTVSIGSGFVCCGFLWLLGSVVPAAENIAPTARLMPQRSYSARSFQVSHVVDGKAAAEEDTKFDQCWRGWSPDLRYDPLDFVLGFGKPRVIDRVVVTSCRLDTRLTDFDVYAWAGADWDGHQPLAVVRDSKQVRMEGRFDAVRTSKICIRMFDSADSRHRNPLISEIEVYAAKGPAKRKLRAGGLLKRVQEMTTVAELEAEAARLRKLPEAQRNRFLAWRLESIENKLAGHREAAPWIKRLAQVDRETEQLLAAGVPEWAAAQRSALCKYILWIHWWIGHQQSDGQFGGGWGDDVELTCGWPVACLAADDRKTFDSLALLADGIWESIGEQGYANFTDVEHAAEPISYSQPRMVVLDYDNPKWAKRCAVSVNTCLRDFMDENGRGMLQFKSPYFGYRKGKAVVDEERLYTIPQCPKALKPGLYAAWRGNEEMKQLMIRFGDTWLDAAMQETDSKPRGLLPEQIDFKTGKAVGLHLWMPPMRATYYHLIGCYVLTGDAKYLEPIKEMIRFFLVEKGSYDLPKVREYVGSDPVSFLVKKGSSDLPMLREYVGGDHVSSDVRYGSQLATIASGWRILTQDTTFDPYFTRWSRQLSGALGDRYETYVFIDRERPGLWVRKPLEVGAYLRSRYAIGSQFYIGWLASGDKSLLANACYNLSCDLSDEWGPLTWWFYDKTEVRHSSNDHSAHSLQTAATALMLMYTGGYGTVEAKYPTLPIRRSCGF